jgi:hypothetical protein
MRMSTPSFNELLRLYNNKMKKQDTVQMKIYLSFLNLLVEYKITSQEIFKWPIFNFNNESFQYQNWLFLKTHPNEL